MPGKPRRAEADEPSTATLTFHPLTPDRWADLEALFGPRGACAGCWCMWWRLASGEFEHSKGEPNRQRLRAIVEAGEPTGILAYDPQGPVGWCAVAPREDYPRLVRSKKARPAEGKRVWSIACLFVARRGRRRGVSAALVQAAASHALAQGAEVVEAYPVEPRTGGVPDVFAWTGLRSAFDRAGFVEVGRSSPTRPVLWLASSAAQPRAG